MGDYIKLFETDSERITYEGSNDYIEPYVSYVDGDNTVHYNKPPETRVVAKFNVTSTTYETPIACYYGGPTSTTNGIDEIEIDGVVQPTTKNTYLFETTGEHIVKYTLSDPTTIIAYTFAACPEMINVTIPKSVTSIGGYAFVRHGIRNIEIPDNITSIGSMAFGSWNARSISIGSGVTSIAADAFSDCNYKIGEFINNSALDEVANNYWGAVGYDYYENGLLIGNNCLVNSDKDITSAIIPNGVTSIANNAFQGCKDLTSVTIPNSVTSIGEGVFYYCENLSSVTIGNGITNIGAKAFYCCGLTSITISAMAAPTIVINTTYDNTFSNVRPNGTLYIPTGSTGYSNWTNSGTPQEYRGQSLYNWSTVRQ